MRYEKIYAPPSRENLLGTDALGRDILSRIIWGARTSVFVGCGATLLALVLGVSIGAIAGYAGGATSQILMRLADIQLSIPQLILLVVVAGVLGKQSLLMITVIIGYSMWPRLARVTRSKVLSLRHREFVEAARGIGMSHARILLRHILPNSIGPILVLATLDIGAAIISETSLSFLGLGDPLAISWGNILSGGLSGMVYAPWITIFPGVAIFLTVWGLNVFGDALRDALDVEG
jgi:peptide/nickel transport system permease protein